ncbi:MAG TPA: cytochrome c [Phycisphaeraceae bacterium]|nr:cytochrome c [Phycisphaeraceae bacterium]
MPKAVIYILLILTAASWIPLALITRARAMKSEVPRVHWFQDMDFQPKVKAQAEYDLFADNRGMRPEIPGTVARGDLRADDHFYRGIVTVNGKEQWASDFPAQVKLNERFLRLGREKFNIYCSVCHGFAGDGDGVIAKRAIRLKAGTWGWVPPTSLHEETVVERENGHIFNTITNGIRTMPAYGAQIEPMERWAIVAYVRALQFSRNASADDVPQDMRDSLK